MSRVQPTAAGHLATVEAALAERLAPASVDALLAPLRAAIGAPAADRDPAALVEAIERVDDVLEAIRLVRGAR